MILNRGEAVPRRVHRCGLVQAWLPDVETGRENPIGAGQQYRSRIVAHLPQVRVELSEPLDREGIDRRAVEADARERVDQVQPNSGRALPVPVRNRRELGHCDRRSRIALAREWVIRISHRHQSSGAPGRSPGRGQRFPRPRVTDVSLSTSALTATRRKDGASEPSHRSRWCPPCRRRRHRHRAHPLEPTTEMSS
jgi:hypothetical protein